MVTKPKPISVTDETDWPKLLNDATKAPVRLEREGVIFQLVLEDPDITYSYDPDPEAVRQVLDQSLGSWSHLDTDKMIEELYAARRAGTRRPDRP